MNLVLRKNNPFNLIDKTFEDFLGRSRWPGLVEDLSYPVLDMYENDKEVVVKAELPGVDKEDIDISVENQILSIKGEKHQEKETEKDTSYCSERSYGTFSRAVSLPSEVNTQKVEATFKSGILEIRLPKSEGAKLKRIPVKGE